MSVSRNSHYLYLMTVGYISTVMVWTGPQATATPKLATIANPLVRASFLSVSEVICGKNLLTPKAPITTNADDIHCFFRENKT